MCSGGLGGGGGWGGQAVSTVSDLCRYNQDAPQAGDEDSGVWRKGEGLGGDPGPGAGEEEHGGLPGKEKEVG